MQVKIIIKSFVMLVFYYLLIESALLFFTTSLTVIISMFRMVAISSCVFNSFRYKDTILKSLLILFNSSRALSAFDLLYVMVLVGTRGQIRTDPVTILSRLPLPLGYTG